VAVAITVGNTTPSATNDTYTVAAQAPLSVPSPGLLANDLDPDGTSLSATKVDGPSHGSVVVEPSGAFRYTPAPDFAGTDSFSYRASDGAAQSAPATVIITVSPSTCGPRPKVQTTPVAGGGKLQVHVETSATATLQNNPLKSVRFGALQNAKVTLNGQPMADNQTFTPPTTTFTLDFVVERVTPGQPTTVPFTVVDGCGEWPTFVGGGAAAAF
jgi:hypothetical protein